MQRMTPAWMSYQQADQLFDVRNLGATPVEIPDEVTVLWIVQPRGLSNETLYAIDQFIMAGGKALIFVDPVADVDPLSGEGMPQGMPPMGQGSDLPALFDAWGIDFTAQDVVADAELALQISGMGGRPMRHYGYLGVTDQHMNADDVTTAQLNVVHLATAGSLSQTEASTVTFEPLMLSSPSSQLMAATRFSYLPDPSVLQSGFVPGGEPRILAARISGELPSAFPNGQPPDSVSSVDGDAPATEDPDHLSVSADPANVIVVADVDVLADHLWVQVQSFFGQQIANTFASNGAFVINALENLSGSADLIGVRSRASFTRPFTRVEALRVDAEARFRATEERLQSELEETEQRLVELQAEREDSGIILLSPEQQAEIDRFTEQRASIRQDLRAVQRGLDEDIERLGTVLKVINIGLVPVSLAVFALLAVWRRNRRQDV